MKNPKLNTFNAFNLAKEAGVKYDRLSKAINYETGINLTQEEGDAIIKHAMFALACLKEVIYKERSL